MITVENTVLILLAAGQSERFGAANKLEQEFLGRPVGLHVATALENMPFKARIVVRDGTSLEFPGYTVVHNADPSSEMSQSVKLGVECARSMNADAVLIALADMPRVTAAHIYRLFDAVDGNDAVVASSDGEKPCPPALFGRDRFDFLLSLDGDSGARDLVKAGRHVVTAPAELIDIDTPEDLERLRELVGSPAAITRAAARRSD